MKRFAVAVASFFDNELVTEIIRADDWRDALRKHSRSPWRPSKWDAGDLPMVPMTIEDAKQQAFDMDGLIDVVLVD